MDSKTCHLHGPLPLMGILLEEDKTQVEKFFLIIGHP